MKIKKYGKTLELLEKCKVYNGIITPKTVDILDSLKEKQLINEIPYQRLTIVLKIKQQRRVKLNSEKFKMIMFTINELQCSIRNAIKLENELSNSIDTPLNSVL